MLSTFRPSKPSKPAKSISLSNGKTQLSSGLLEQSGTGKAPSEQSFVKPPPDAVDENSRASAAVLSVRTWTLWPPDTE